MDNKHVSSLGKLLLFVVSVTLILIWIFTLVLNLDPVIFGVSYPVVPLIGCVYGIIIAKEWKINTSMIGRVLTLFTIGLFGQLFGQIVFTSYILFFNVDIPYPSFADLGFFSSIILYMIAAYQIAKFSGIRFSNLTKNQKCFSVILYILVTALFFTFSFFNYEFVMESPLHILLDFGYPFFEALSLTITILTYIYSKHSLSGLLRSRILFLLFALMLQYIADINFSYQAIAESWVNSGYGDFIYMLAYIAMAYALLRFDITTIHSEKMA